MPQYERVFGNATWPGNTGISLTPQDAPGEQVEPRVPNVRPGDLRKISSEFPTRHVFSFPWARKATVSRLLMR